MTMLRKLSLAGLFMVVCLLPFTTEAQQAASVSQIREQIRRMLAVELDAATPPDVRELNRTLLKQRRAQLRELLQRRLDATLKYRADFKAVLTPDLDASIRQTINELIREINELGTGVAANTRARRTARPSRRVQNVQPAMDDEAAQAQQSQVFEPVADEDEDVDADADTDPVQSRAARKRIEVLAATVTTEEKPVVTIMVSDPDIKQLTVEVVYNKQSVFTKNDIKVERGRLVPVPMQLDKLGEGKNLVNVTGLTIDGDTVKATPFLITRRVTAARTDGEKPTDKGQAANSRITIEEPKDKLVYSNAPVIDLKFRVEPPKKADEKKIDSVYFTVQNNRKFIDQEQPEVAVNYKQEGGADKPDTTPATARLNKGENLLTLNGYANGVFVSQTSVTVTCSGDKCDDGKTADSRIKVIEPRDHWVYRNAPVIGLRLRVEKGDKEIKKIYVRVENEKRLIEQSDPDVVVKAGAVKTPPAAPKDAAPAAAKGGVKKGGFVKQDKPEVAVKTKSEGEAEEPETLATVVLKEGTNTITLIGYDEEDNQVAVTSLTVTCVGAGCNDGGLASTIPSNSSNMRAVVGFEQAGASSSSSESKPFLDLFFFGPLRHGKKCRGVPKGVPEGDNCFPILETWGDVRFSSVPQQVAAFGTLASNFVNPLADGQLNELVQGFNYMAGLDFYLFSNDKDFSTPIPGVKHRTAVYLTAGAGAISPLTPRQSAQVFEIPVAGNPQREAFLKEFPEAAGDNKKYIAFVSPDRDRFLRQYYGGVRFKTYFTDRDGNLINRFPATLDVTFGQSDSVTGGRLHKPVFRLDAFYPFPVKEASFLYFYGSAFMKLGGTKLDKTPFILTTAPSSVQLTGNDVVITTRPVNRDFYRIGIGVNLTDLFNRPQRGTN